MGEDDYIAPMSKGWTAEVVLTDKTLETGERVKAPALLMKRKLEGETVYRRPSPEEEAEYVSSEAW